VPLSRVQPERYPALLEKKVDAVCQLLAPFSPPAPIVTASSPEGFRLRAEFRVWHDGDALDYVMFARDDPETPVPVTNFPIAARSIQALMPVLREKLQASAALRRKLFQAEFLTALAGGMVVTLVYHRKLDTDWETEAQALVDTLREDWPGLSVVGRSRRQKLVIGDDFVREVLTVNGATLRVRQYEQAFTQPNGEVNLRMIAWACDLASNLGGDLLELYCGNGNFTLPLSSHFGSVIATEVAKTAVRAARHNIEENGIENVHLVRMSAAEVGQAIDGVRRFRRLDTLPRPLEDYRLDTLFVAPPRAGLDEQTLALARRFRTVIYVSCNPHSLAANLCALQGSHRIVHLALFDQFPYTDHMECGVLLQRRELNDAQ